MPKHNKRCSQRQGQRSLPHGLIKRDSPDVPEKKSRLDDDKERNGGDRNGEEPDKLDNLSTPEANTPSLSSQISPAKLDPKTPSCSNQITPPDLDLKTPSLSSQITPTEIDPNTPSCSSQISSAELDLKTPSSSRRSSPHDMDSPSLAAKSTGSLTEGRCRTLRSRKGRSVTPVSSRRGQSASSEDNTPLIEKTPAKRKMDEPGTSDSYRPLTDSGQSDDLNVTTNNEEKEEEEDPNNSEVNTREETPQTGACSGSAESAGSLLQPSTSSDGRRRSPRERIQKPQVFNIEQTPRRKRTKGKRSLSTSAKRRKGHNAIIPPPDHPIIVTRADERDEAGPSGTAGPSNSKQRQTPKTSVLSAGASASHEKSQLEKNLCAAVHAGLVLKVESLLKELSSSHTDYEHFLTKALFDVIPLGHKRIIQLLVKYGSDFKNAVNQKDQTTLHVAVESNYPDVVKYLVKRGANVNFHPPNVDSVLMTAVKGRKCVPMIKFLIHSGADVNYQDAQGVTVAMVCVTNYDFDMLKVFIDHKCNLNLTDNDGNTVFTVATSKGVKQTVELLASKYSKRPSFLLHRAINMNCVSTVSTLLDCDFIDVNVCVDRGATALNSALAKGKHASCDIVRELLNYGADVEKEDQDGTRPLAIAAASGRLDLVKLLISHGAKINAKGREKNMTALMHAARKGYTTVVEHLIENKANINLRDNQSYTALTYALEGGRLDCVKLLLCKKAIVHKATDLQAAVFNGHTEATKIMLEWMNPRELDSMLLFNAVEDDNVEIAKLLIKYGADVNGLNFMRETPLMQVRTRAMATLLIDKGAFVDCQNPLEGKTALMEAANYRHSQVVAVLIERNANVNLTDTEGNTPLIFAALGSNPEAAEMLLDAGADGNLMNRRNLSALMAAAQRGMGSIVKALLDKGVDVNAKSSKDETALMYASMNSHCTIVKLLLENGAKVNMQDHDGNTALLMTRTSVIGDMLMSAGAEVNLRNRDGKSALMLVLEQIFCDADLVKGLISNKAEVFVLNAQKTKSPLSSLLRKQVLTSSDYVCLQELLKAGAARMSAPYHCSAAPLVKLILVNKPSIIQNWVTSGAPPAMVCNHCLVKERCCTTSVSTLLQCSGVSEVSPFIAALLCGNLEIAQYFVDIWFLTSSDVNGEFMQKGIRNVLEKLRQPRSVEFLDCFFTEPLPLVKLSFFSVLQSLKCGPDREDKVKGTDLPHTLQDQLLFKPNSKFSLNGPDSDTLFSDVLNYTPNA